MQNPSPMATALSNYPTLPQPSSPHHGPDNPGNYPQLHVEGYPKLAFFFSHCIRYLHLRRFSAVAIRLLLYRHHRIIVLEKNLLELEKRDINSSEPDRQHFCADFGRLQAESKTRLDCEQEDLYEELKHEMKEYEEAILRFDRLGVKGYDVAGIRTIQWFQAKKNGSYRPLSGLDASVWGHVDNTKGHASDIIQVVEQSNPSVIGRFFRDKILLWSPQLSAWLWPLIFWSKKRPGAFDQYNFSGRAFEVVSLALGNFVTSLLIYAAVTSLYFTADKAASVAGVVIIAGVITVCSALFRNEQFISMLATVCAVLVALLLNDGNQRSRPTHTSP